MAGTPMHDIALDALRTRTLIRLPFDGGDGSLIGTLPAAGGGVDMTAPVAHLVDETWATEGAGRYDGALLGVDDIAVSADAVSLACRAIRYRDYIATDRVLDADPAARFPLAVGVHAILLAGDSVLCLRLQDGRLALPGGAVDAADLAPSPKGAIVRAAVREIAEETGIALAPERLEATGLYVGGRPTHILAMLTANLGDDFGAALRAFVPADTHDQVSSLELRSLAGLIEGIETLPLVARAALRSLLHRRGHEPAWTIPA